MSLGRDALGKAIFLETLGFDNARIMGGAPLEATLLEVAQSYAGRLRPRHAVLARLAREGLSPQLLTTNYDLLVEGAYRLAGLVPRMPGFEAGELAPSHLLPTHAWPRRRTSSAWATTDAPP